jgi:hypothetical protein
MIALTDGGTPTITLSLTQLGNDATVLGLITSQYQIAISDTSAHVQSDLTSGTPLLLASYNAAITSVTLTDGSPEITLNVSQLRAASAILAVTSPAFGLTISDSMADVQYDLTHGSPTLIAHAGIIDSIALTDGGTPTLTLNVAQLQAADTALAAIDSSYDLAISDSALDVQNDLASNAESAILNPPVHATLTAITLTSGTSITLTDTAARYSGVAAALQLAGALTSFTVTGVLVADIGAIAALDVTGTHMQISDTAAHVQANLVLATPSTVTNLAKISTIALTDVGTPTITLNVTQLQTDSTALGDISSSYHLAISDSAAAVQGDLASGGTSAILANLGALSGITLPADSTITLTENQAVHAGVATALDRATGLGEFLVTGVAIAQIATVLGMGVSNTMLHLGTTSGAVQADLLGGSSVITANLADIAAIVLTDSSPAMTLSVNELHDNRTALGLISTSYQIAIDDSAENVAADLANGASSDLLHPPSPATISTIAFSDTTLTLTEPVATANGVAALLLASAGLSHFVVTGVQVAQVVTVIGLDVPNTSIHVSDIANDIQNDLTGGTSQLLANLSAITQIAVSDSGTISLTSAQVQAAGVDDGAGSVASLLSGGHLVVTGVLVADLNTIAGLPVVPYQIGVSDTALDIQNDLTGGNSRLLAHKALLSGVAIGNAGTVALSETQIRTAGVDDGAGSVLANLSGGGLEVTGVLAADAGIVAALAHVTIVVVSDTALDIQDDLTSGSSELLAHIGVISSITVSDAGTISLSETELDVAGVDDGAGSVFSKVSGGFLQVTGVPVSDVTAILAKTGVTSIHVSDAASTVQTSLLDGASSVLEENAASITAIGFSSGTAVTLDAASALATLAALAELPANSLTITGAAVGNIVTLTGLSALHQMSVSGTAGTLQGDLANGGTSVIGLHVSKIDGIAITGGGTITLTDGSVAGVNAALALLPDSSLILDDVAAANVGARAGLGALISMTVSATTAGIQADLTAATPELLTHLGVITAITVTDSATLHLTDTQAQAAGASFFDEVSGLGGLAVSAVLVADIPTILGLGVTPTSMAVVDSASNVVNDLNLDASSKLLVNEADISSVTLSDSSVDVVTATTIYDALLGAGITFNESALTITGSGANLATAYADVPDLLSDAHAVTLTGNPSGISAEAATALAVYVTELTDGQTLSISDSSGNLLNAAYASGIALATSVGLSGPITTDAATATELADLHNFNDGADITIHDNPTNLTAGANAAGVDIAATAAMDGNYSVNVQTLGELVAIPHFVLGGRTLSILDSASNITSDLISGASKIIADKSLLTAVKPNNASLDVVAASAIYTPLHSNSISFDETGLAITGTAANLLSAETTVAAMLAAAADGVTLSADATNESAANATTLAGFLTGLGGRALDVVDSAADIVSVSNEAGIALATSVALNAIANNLSAANATILAGLGGKFTAGYAINVSDSVSNLVLPGNASGVALATAVTLNASYTDITTAQLASLAGISPFSRGSGNNLTVEGLAAAITALTPTELGLTTGVVVSDSSASVTSHLDSLQTNVTANDHPLTILLNDGTPGTPTVFITATTYGNDQATIDAISGTAGAVKVTDGAAAIAAIAAELQADTVVGEVVVSDSAANIVNYLPTLTAIGSKFDTVDITGGGTLTAATVAPLLGIANISAPGGVTIADTGSQIAAAIAANGAPGLAFLNSVTVELSIDSVISASDALELALLTEATSGISTLLNGYTLEVWDTAAHLTSSTYLSTITAGVGSGLISGVYLKTTSGTATITTATLTTLFGIDTFSTNTPTGGTNHLIVSDTAAHLDAAKVLLNTESGSISSIVISATATVDDAVFQDLLTMGAVKGANVTLTLRDTEATIIADARAAPSLVPNVWAITADATVDATDAIYLGNLAGFNPGSYTLTLSSTASVSVANANLLGSMASFRLGESTELQVAGSVSYVSGLTTAAKSIVTALITDTFANLSTLLTSGSSALSGLLTGTLTVSENDTVTTAEVIAFLDLLGNGGISVAHVNFGGHTVTVTDTLVDLATITGSAAWSSVSSHIALTAADTVANLIALANPGSAATLATLTATTLEGAQSSNANQAETLATVQSTIHFSLDGNHLTILDTASDLLNPTNVDGIALAYAFQLSASAMVAAVDAETLLGNVKFSAGAYTLTVSDTSANLLDGVLGPLLPGGNVHVQLSDTETLDADTAEALVSLTGFVNTYNLSIADGSSYLLNSANLTAEQDATSVTLAGDETVSAATAASLEALPGFNTTGGVLDLASNDYANAATLIDLANLGSGFQLNGNTLTLTQNASVNAAELAAIGNFGSGLHINSHTLTMTQDALALTPTEYTALQSDSVVQGSYALSVLPTGASVNSAGGDVVITATGVSGATLHVYAAGGSALSSSVLGSSAISVSQSDAFGTVGGAVVITETMPGHTAAAGESAPIIALDQTVITTDATAASASFSASGGAGMVQVGVNEYMTLYTAGQQPAHPTNPVLVYDPSAHTLSFDVASTSIVLVTLGAATHPASLDASEINIKHFV